MSPDERNERGDTPLNIAAYAGQTAAVEELLRHGANVNATNNKVKVVYLLLDYRFTPKIPLQHSLVLSRG